MSKSSYREILLSSSMIGGAQIINIAAGILKMKVVAEVMGPAGVGLMGMYLSLIQTASLIAALGLSSVGARQVAEANADGLAGAIVRTRRALFWGTLVLALIGSGLFWLLSGWIARVVLADHNLSDDVAWLSVGVMLTVFTGSQGALLTGLRRIGDLARITVVSAVFSTTLGLLAVWFWGAHGLIAMVIATPFFVFLLGNLYVLRLPRPPISQGSLLEVLRELRTMLTLGFAFMLGGLVTTAGHFAARAMVQQELGVEAVGHFHAAWVIGIAYLGFVLGAMATDYFPRLTAVIGDKVTAARLVNEQTEVALLLCAPMLLTMLGLAPWVISLLYSNDFAPAVEILRWQILGDILKLISWPLGFVILAAGKGKTFVLTESLGMAVFLIGIALGLPLIGVAATGLAFLALYVLHMPLMWLLCRRHLDFRWTRAVKLQGMALIAAAFATDIVSRWDDVMGAVLGVSLASLAVFWALQRLSTIADLNEKFKILANLLARGKNIVSLFR